MRNQLRFVLALAVVSTSILLSSALAAERVRPPDTDNDAAGEILEIRAMTDPEFMTLTHDVASAQQQCMSGAIGSLAVHCRKSMILPTNAITIANQLAAFTNMLVARMKVLEMPDVTALGIENEISNYPLLVPFFERAAEPSVLSGTFAPTNPGQPQLTITAGDEKQLLKLDREEEPGDVHPDTCYTGPCIDEYLTCGWYSSPRPTTQAAWTEYSSANPTQTLLNLGYHPPSGDVGQGWTRPVTYKSWLCGWNTFRDHGYPKSTSVREQRYKWFTPPGEPNPEVWISGPWPYPTWPGYVWWWHTWGPGK